MPTLAIGVDGCRSGWFFVALEQFREGEWSIAQSGIVCELKDLVDRIPDRSSQSARVFVDIPIGLPDGTEGRECDKMARKSLGAHRASSVFSVPARCVVDAVGDEREYKRAKRLAEGATRGNASLSSQSFSILPKIREVDQLLRGNTRAWRIVREVHPEVCFRAFAGLARLKHKKAEEEGFQERIRWLDRIRPSADQDIRYMRQRFGKCGVARDDAVDALAAALTATAVAPVTLPEDPAKDSMGLPMEMVYATPDMISRR